MKIVWRIIDELMQILWWMVGIGLIAFAIDATLKGFLALPIWLKVSLLFATAVLCKHWRDVHLWYEKTASRSTTAPDL